MRLLREYIKALVNEAIARPQLEPKRVSDLYTGEKNAAMHRPHFKLNEFKRLTRLDDMLDYAHKNLEELGFGSSRSVYRLTGTRVIKIANTLSKGVAQNKAEMDIFTDPQTAPIVTKIFDYDTKFRWLISEVVRPLREQEDFQEIIGITWPDFYEILTQTYEIPDNWDLDDEQTEFLNSALSLGTKNKLMSGDLAVLGHWGKTADGRLVILDYGYTREVQQLYTRTVNWFPEQEEEEPSWPVGHPWHKPKAAHDDYDDDDDDDYDDISLSKSSFDLAPKKIRNG